ncbi:TPA: glycosyltransferase family 4 protein [Candidatus Saccharibacteria bacterium]|nr:glycosyltransferase family 4 protein [Candidatus Saccharibacteria bacterium]HIO87864.1 glycosyltransferase family 4 protein [Candidatus Saccharibacteria bacterium]
MKVAIVQDWISSSASGAERVVLELHKIFPDAPIYTSTYDHKPGSKFETADVRTTFLQSIPGAKSKHQLFPLLRRRAFGGLDLTDYDVVISSSGAEAKAVKTRPDALHICYCHAPTHYYWSRYEEYLKRRAIGFIDPFAKAYLRTTIKGSRRWDYLAAQNPDIMLANSTHIAREIKKYYDRPSEVVFPPIDIERFNLSTAKRSGFVVVGRQVHYKRFDLAITAANKTNKSLLVVGRGPMHQQLRAIAGPTVKFITDASDDEVVDRMSGAEALLFPGLDDFGIVPVEAMATGTPVIAYKGGGALDYINAITGKFFDKQTPDSLAAVMRNFDTKNYKPADIRKQSRKFSSELFQSRILDIVKKHQ